MVKRNSIIALIVMALVLSFTACNKPKQDATPAADSNTFTLPFHAEDAINPYSCRSECNLYLSPLIYDSLITINDKREVVNALAESYIIEDNTITLKLKPALFSDGSEVTSDDVIHSFNQAKQSERYKEQLRLFSSADRKGSSVVRFTLSQKNIYALNLLTFPIISQKNNNIGSGYYALEKENDVYTLTYNKNHEGAKPQMETIALTACSDYSAAPKLFNNEQIDYLFEIFDLNNVRTAAIHSQKAKLNNLVFVGLNSKKGLLKDKNFRNAIQFSLNQNKLCEQAMEGYGVPTATPFDSEWSEIGSIVSNSVLSNAKQAKEAFAAAGCAYDKMGISLMYEEEPITLELIVNSASNMKIAIAEMIKTELINCGIAVEVKKMPLDEYNIAIENENFDMYIGEVKISNDFNFDCFFTTGGGADFGIHAPDLQNIYANFKKGDASLQDFVSAFCEENPFVPIGYKCANVCFGANVDCDASVSENNMYAHIEEWSK